MIVYDTLFEALRIMGFLTIHGLRLVLASVVLVTVSACTTTFAYRHADWFLSWKIDQYLDLSRDQRRVARGQLKQLLGQHRREALPVYEMALLEIKQKATDGLSSEDLDWAFDRYRQLRADLIERVLPDGVALLTSIDEAQVRHLEQALKKDTDNATRRANEEPETREARRAGAAIRVLKEWLGSLSWEQEQEIRALVRSFPHTDGVKLAYWEQRREEFVQLLRSPSGRHVLTERLREWLLFPEHIAPEYAHSEQQKQEGLKRLALAVDRFITSTQRAYALRRLQALIDDVHALASS